MKQYSITGMTCSACSIHIEKAVLKVPGVTSCSVNLLTNSMVVEGNVSTQDIIFAVEKSGYAAKPKEGKEHFKYSNKNRLKQKETLVIKNRLIVSLCFLIVLMYFSMGYKMLGFSLPVFFNNNYVAIGLVQLILSAVIMVINQNFFINGFRNLWNKSPNMDSLVSLGSGVSFIYSVYILFKMTSVQAPENFQTNMTYTNGLYFESAAMILTLITVGKLLEARSKGKTTNALQRLMSLAPKTATIFKDNKEQKISVEEVKTEDIFVVRPGESIPVDGIVLEGSSAVNESTLTGESIPVDKVVGNSVSAGTINQSGFIKCKATKVGEDTFLSQIIRMVTDATSTKAPISRIADKVSGIFVPSVILIAVISVIIWILAGANFAFALERGISVLVISCPCALGLATPVSIMVGNGIGAKYGILFKTAVSLEETGKISIAAFDKTGTITLGKPKVTDIISINGYKENELLSLAFSLETKSEHPLAKAIIVKAQEEKIIPLEINNFKALTGNGLSAVIEGEILIGGNLKFIQNYVSIADNIKSKISKLADEGKTPLLFAKGKNLIGVIAVADIIKEDSYSAIKELQNMGIYTVMLTGDNRQTANTIGKQIGIDEIISDLLPAEKESIIQKLKLNGKVAMVGDGINDAPALTSADIGIAIGSGTDIAIDSADIVLIKNKLSDVSAAIQLSYATLKNIYQNLFWAFFYNIIGIPLAAGVLFPVLGWKLTPMFGAAAMSLSSLCVVLNALRLNFFNLYDNISKNSKITMNRRIKFMKKIIGIEGMMCKHCEKRVKDTLEDLPEINNAVVSHKSKTAVISLKSEIDDSKLKKIIENQGYHVTSID